MLFEIESVPLNNGYDLLIYENDVPKCCPTCGTSFASKPITAHHYFWDNDDCDFSGAAVYFCPHCEQFFFERIYSELMPDEFEDYKYIVYESEVYPKVKSVTEFSSPIHSISPGFVKIFREAEVAENNELYEIAGIGYRKALEFLIKDYCIILNRDKREKIAKAKLSTCIQDYIKDEKIKTIALTSAWLGNDETHYLRRLKNSSIAELKRFISTLVSYLENEATYIEAKNIIEQNNKSK